jgi:hypothetical protein
VFNSEIGLQKNNEDSKILVFNVDNLKSKEVILSNGRQKNLRLMHLNAEYLYFVDYDDMLYYNSLRLIKRSDLSILKVLPIGNRSKKGTIQFDKNSQIYDLDKRDCSINVYSSIGSFLYKVLYEEKFEFIRFSFIDSIVYNQVVKEKSIEYDEINY